MIQVESYPVLLHSKELKIEKGNVAKKSRIYKNCVYHSSSANNLSLDVTRDLIC